MQNYIMIAIGAVFGGILRYWSTNIIQKHLPLIFPFGTLFVNFLGSLILGFVIFYFDEKELISNHIKILLTIGFCGSFTTFSTFSYETVVLIRDSEILFGLLNVLLNISFSVAAIISSYFITKIINGG